MVVGVQDFDGMRVEGEEIARDCMEAGAEPPASMAAWWRRITSLGLDSVI